MSVQFNRWLRSCPLIFNFHDAPQELPEMRRLSPIEALKPQARRVTVTAGVATTAPAALTLRRPVPHWPLILQGQQTWTSTTSSKIINLLPPKLNTRRHPRDNYWLATSRPSILATRIASLRHRRPGLLGAMASAFSAYHGPAAIASQHTVTALGRWSILNHALPGL